MMQSVQKAKNMSESSDDKTYVFEGVEVKLTGRTAKKEMKTQRRRVAAKLDLIHEIAPADKEMGNWKKWVRMTELFEIVL